MSAFYRVVHFAPDPFSGWRVPIGALLSHADRPVFVQADWLPGAGCLGSEAASAVLRMIVEAVARSPDLQRLPAEAGPQAALSDSTPVPSSVSDPARWLAEHVLPGKPHASLAEKEYSTRREVYGRRFFEQYQVWKWVGRRLNPRALSETVSPLSAGEITHYVQGKDELLLLEPVVATRPNFEKDIAEISQLFLAWRQLLSETPQTPRARLIAYAIPLGMRERVAAVRDVLEQHRFEVVDVDAASERDAFLASVRRVGLSRDMFSNVH